MSSFRSLFTCGLTALAFPALADPITLTGRSSDIVIEGELRGFDGEFYEVETDLGVLTVDARTVTCAGTDCPAPADMMAEFSLVGSGELTSVMLPNLLEAFSLTQGASVMANRTGDGVLDMIVATPDGQELAAVSLQEVPETAGFAAMQQSSDIMVAASRPPSADEADAQANADGGDLMDFTQNITLARDAIVFAVSQINPIDVISTENLRRTLTGEIDNWKDIGGPDAPINLYVATGQEGFDHALTQSSLGLEPGSYPDTVNSYNLLATTSDMVAADPFGLAVTSYSQLRGARALGLRGACGVVMRPGGFEVKSGSYPFAFEHKLYHSAERPPLFARDFKAFVDTQPAHALTESLGYVGLGLSEAAAVRQGDRLIRAIQTATDLESVQRLSALMAGATQLSTVFRFDELAELPDDDAAEAIGRLAAEFNLGAYADKELILASFHDDGDGGSAILSEAMADFIRTALVATAADSGLMEDDFEIIAFDNTSPLDCSDTVAGQMRNTRVEIWVRDRQ